MGGLLFYPAPRILLLIVLLPFFLKGPLPNERRFDSYSLQAAQCPMAPQMNTALMIIKLILDLPSKKPNALVNHLWVQPPPKRAAPRFPLILCSCSTASPKAFVYSELLNFASKVQVSIIKISILATDSQCYGLYCSKHIGFQMNCEPDDNNSSSY